MSTFLDIPFTVWAAICLAIALIYYFVWPKPKQNGMERPCWAQFLLRYGHSAVWVLLGVVCLIWPTGGTGLAQVLGLLALIVYGAFLVTMVWYRRKVKRDP